MRQCKICKKGSVIRGKRKLLRGHYNPTSKSRKYPNLQWAKVPAKGGSASGGESIRKMICTSCLRTLNKPNRTKSKSTSTK